MNIGRRQVLRTTVGATLGRGVASWAESGGKDAKLDRMACNSWPFRAYFDTPEMHQYRESKYPLVTQAEFPEFLADHFQIHNVEFLPQHFVDTDASNKVKEGLNKAKSRCCNLMGVEVPGGVYSVDANVQAIAKIAERWVGVAVALGSPCITLALSGEGPIDPQTVVRNVKPFVEIARRKNIKVLFHNDDIKRESAEILTAVVEQLGSGRTGTCPDFGNFATRSSAYALSQLRMLAPFASLICHAKDGIADKGRLYTDDFSASMKVMRHVRFRGLYSLEYEGMAEPLAGVSELLKMTEEQLS